jgi:hypothetical protein
MDDKSCNLSVENNTKCPSEKGLKDTASPSPTPPGDDLETRESASSLHCYNLPDYRVDPEILRVMQSTENKAKRRSETKRRSEKDH